MSRAPRIAILTSSLTQGGSEVQVTTLGRGLKSAGWDVTVVSFQPGPMEAELLEADIHVLNLRIGRVSTPSAWLDLSRLVRRLAPDIVHTQAFRANIWGRLAAVRANIPVVVSVRATYSYLPRAYYPIERLLAQWTAAIVTPSKATADHLTSAVKISSSLISVIPNAVDTDLFMPNGSGDAMRRAWGTAGFVVLAPGRLVPQKNHGGLVNAFRTVAERRPDSTLVIAGTGPLESEIRRQALPLGDRVVFAGELPHKQMVEAMAAADVVCLASHFEGMPNVLLEAMACGKPVAASGVDGASEVVEDGLTGFLTPPEDAPALAQSLLKLADDPSLRSKMGALGRQRAVAEYSPALNIQRHITLYERVLKHSPKQSPN